MFIAAVVYLIITMSKPRPGVEAGKRLFACQNIEVWQLVDTQHDIHVLDQIKTLKQVDIQYRALGTLLNEQGKEFITKDELLLVVKWKFLVGKARPALMKHLHSNSDDDVKKSSTTEHTPWLPT